jgi:RNA polymerase sigma-70 factor (ECF subfamily)
VIWSKQSDGAARVLSVQTLLDTSFDEFYRQEFPIMVALAVAVSGSRVAAEDIAQEAFIRAHRKWSDVSKYGRPGTWVRRVTINLATDIRRRVASEARALVRMGPPRMIDPPSEPDDVLWKAVARLPRKQRSAVALFYVMGLSTAEIAETLECAESTARVHLHKARSALAASIGGRL